MVYSKVKGILVKPLHWVGSSRGDLREFPDEVKQDIGFALHEVQDGRTPEAAKPLKGFGSADVLELIERYDGGSYRAVYTVRFRKAVYVLHSFQKKSKRGIKTSSQDIELIKRRLRAAEEDYRAIYREKTSQ